MILACLSAARRNSWPGADWQDFNGRIGLVLLAALLYKLALPHVVTAPSQPNARRLYLNALQAADDGNLVPLADFWTFRIAEAL